MSVLKAGGANVRLAASNPLSTQDEVAAALVKYEKFQSLPSRVKIIRPIIAIWSWLWPINPS